MTDVEQKKTAELEERRKKTQAVKDLLRMSDTAANAKTLKEIEERERLAGMTPLDQMQYLANRKVEYLDSKMQQHFPSLQAIKAVQGMILLIADEKKAYDAAVEYARQLVGIEVEMTDPEAFSKVVSDHWVHTTLMSVSRFRINFLTIMEAAAKYPQYFGDGRGGSVLRDVYKEARAAVLEAEAYLKKHGDELPEGALSVIDGPEFILDDPKQFERVLGFGWEKNLTREQQSNLKNILGQQK